MIRAWRVRDALLPWLARGEAFRCNICGRESRRPESALEREGASCGWCGSSVRMRAVVHLVSMALFGESIPLPEFPHRPDLRGVGLSDWKRYARGLASRLDYTNTYYHRSPRLDITRVPDSMAASCDFVIASDVFEHVAPPVALAFEGALRLLKPGGTLVLTVPFTLGDAPTAEHFPRLHDFRIEKGRGGQRELVNTTAAGEVERFGDLVFHGGPGDTLEMRVFTREDLLAQLARAGFERIRIASENVPAFGIRWANAWSVPVVARRPLTG